MTLTIERDERLEIFERLPWQTGSWVAFARYHNPVGEIWAMDVGDPVGATAATGSIAITGTATASGSLVRYIGGERYSVGVAVGDTATVVGAALAAVIARGYSGGGEGDKQGCTQQPVD